MHLPDGFLDTKTALLSTGVAAAGVSLALRQVRRSLEPRKTPLLGLAAAFVFAAQMLNFPILGGTSGHLMGGVLAALLLGPAAATVVMTCVLLVQCFMFADGGLTSLGANVLNIAIVNVWGGYLAYRLLRRTAPLEPNRSAVFAATFAGWAGTVLASLTCAGQLAFAQAVPWQLAFPAMANIHMLIGIGEGLATGLIYLAVLRAQPDLAASDSATQTGSGPLLAYGLIVSAGLALFVAPFACPWPDGLESVAQRLGFAAQHTAPTAPAPMLDYKLPFIGSPTLATAAAGLLGTLFAFVGAWCLARLVVPVLGSTKKDASH